MELNNIMTTSIVLFTFLTGLMITTSYLVYKVRKTLNLAPVKNYNYLSNYLPGCDGSKKKIYFYSDGSRLPKQKVRKNRFNKFQIVNKIKPDKFKIVLAEECQNKLSEEKLKLSPNQPLPDSIYKIILN